jgi:hypothetical protein
VSGFGSYLLDWLGTQRARCSGVIDASSSGVQRISFPAANLMWPFFTQSLISAATDRMNSGELSELSAEVVSDLSVGLLLDVCTGVSIGKAFGRLI